MTVHFFLGRENLSKCRISQFQQGGQGLSHVAWAFIFEILIMHNSVFDVL